MLDPQSTISKPTLARDQGCIKASAGLGAVPNAGPLQTYSQHIKIFHCHQLWAPKLQAQVMQHPVNAALPGAGGTGTMGHPVAHAGAPEALCTINHMQQLSISDGHTHTHHLSDQQYR